MKARALDDMRQLEGRGAHVYVPRGDQDYAIDVGLRMLTLRHLVSEVDGLFTRRGRRETAARVLREQHRAPVSRHRGIAADAARLNAGRREGPRVARVAAGSGQK